VKHGEILGRLEVGWEKVVCWSTKAAISLKRVKIGLEEKLLRRAYRESQQESQLKQGLADRTAKTAVSVAI